MSAQAGVGADGELAATDGASEGAKVAPWPPPPSLRASIATALAFALAALVPALALFGFTVDDALITGRYASNIAQGAGYRLSSGGPVTDGVTPLGFAFLLAPFAKGGPLEAVSAAKALGVAFWTVAAAVVGLAALRAVERARHPLVVPLALVASSAPLGAWAASGMETGFVLALGALAASLPLLGRPFAGSVCAGLAAGLRPELLPWAAVLGVGVFLSCSEGRRRAWALVALSLAPFALVACVRLAIFGRAAPLSIFAKAPDPRHGLYYALACVLLAGPLALAAPLAALRLRGFPRVLVLSVVVHLFAIALAGGDWMPLSRLLVPVLPSLALGALFLAKESALAATSVRLAAAVAGQVFVLVHIGPDARRVGEDRLRVALELRPALESARVVAALDIGWVGASTRASIVDLAGVTDPAIAALPGGHTTKQIPAGLLDARGVDTLIVLLANGEHAAEPWTRSRFARGVEAWIATTPGAQEAWTPVAESSPPHLRYLVLRKKR